jgi:hypothetical protein
LPYWSDGRKGIIYNVFLYRSSGRLGDYGIANVLEKMKFSKECISWYKNLFYPLYFAFPLFLPDKNLLKNQLFGVLFFLVFASGFALQYTALPIALGALRGNIGFLSYTLMASFYLMGHGAEVDIECYGIVWHNEVWLAAVFWFLVEIFLFFRKSTKLKDEY